MGMISHFGADLVSGYRSVQNIKSNIIVEFNIRTKSIIDTSLQN